jgi:hypothetical protein
MYCSDCENLFICIGNKGLTKRRHKYSKMSIITLTMGSCSVEISSTFDPKAGNWNFSEFSISVSFYHSKMLYRGDDDICKCSFSRKWRQRD